MGSVVSSENEGPPDDLCRICGHPWERHTTSLPEEGRQNYCTECDEATEFHTFAPVCSSVHGQGGHCFHSSFGGKCCPCPAVCEPPSPEPKGSEGSSPGEHQHCWHYRSEIPGDECCGCFETQKKDAPTGPEPAGCDVQWHVHTGGPTDRRLDTCRSEEETAGEPEAPHEHDWSEWRKPYISPATKDMEMRLCECGAVESRTSEPEAPEEPPCPSCGQQDGTWFDRSICPEPCGSAHSRCANCGAVTGDACINEAPQAPKGPPPRLSYAVAYATGSGALYELVLPDEMTCAVVDGVLVLSHPSGVLGIQQVKPMEGA